MNDDEYPCDDPTCTCCYPQHFCSFDSSHTQCPVCGLQWEERPIEELHEPERTPAIKRGAKTFWQPVPGQKL